MRIIGGDACRERIEQRPRRRVRELHNAVTLACVTGRCDNAMNSRWDDAVSESLEHHAGVDDHLSVGRDSVNPIAVDQHLQTRRRSARQRGDQVDIAMRASPHMCAIRRILHRRVANRARQCRAVGRHLVEQRFVTAQTLGDDAQKAALHVFYLAMKSVEHFRDARHGRFR